MTKVVYVIIAVVAVGIIAMAYYIGYSNGQKSERIEAQRVALEQIAKVRMEDQRRLDESERIANEAKEKLKVATSDARNARNAVSGLHAQLQDYRNKFGYPTIEQCGPANRRGLMLANVFGECTEVVAELARIADNARIAGVACEESYNSIRGNQ